MISYELGEDFVACLLLDTAGNLASDSQAFGER